MDTARIDIAYRPIRIAWAIQSNDFASFRKAVRFSHTLWGGRFNPIVFADRPEDARDLIDLFRADMLLPLGKSPEVAGFAAAYAHLPDPYYSKGLFSGEGDYAHATLLDIENALAFARENRAQDDPVKAEFRTFTWDQADPLADVLLIQLGAYPEKEDCPVNYQAIFEGQLQAVVDTIHCGDVLPTRIFDHPSIAALSSYNVRRHYSIRSEWHSPGFFVGDATNLDDLTTFWNLRATDNRLLFIDRTNFARFSQVIPAFEDRIHKSIAHLDEHQRHITVWARQENLENAKKLFAGRGPLALSGAHKTLWNGLNIKAPMMILGEASTLGVFSESSGKPGVSFALANKPFAGDIRFHNQHLIASVSMFEARAENAQYTFLPPYVPELNEFLGRSMCFHHETLRVEPERVGLVVDAADPDAFVNSTTPDEFFVELFKRAGVSARPSGAGLLARQIIAQLGGVDGGRVFKIPGVRRLIKEHGPTKSFTRNVALNLIGSRDPDRPDASFADHKNLYIERRTEPELTPLMAFTYLVDKGLFRMGADLVCPRCSLTGWTPLDSLKTKITCEYCGAEFDATRQLIAEEWRYRRSGLLGRERNVHGAIPVVLTLQQLHINLHALSGKALYLPPYELEGLPGTEFKKCEIDFLFLMRGREKAELIIGECKDRREAIDAVDIDNFKRIGALLPAERFDVYYLMSKLGSFSGDEIALAMTLNDKYRQRAILLTADELEPYHIYDRATKKVAKGVYASRPEELARITSLLYFQSEA